MLATQVLHGDAAFRFTASGNAEVLTDWFQKAIAAGYEPAYPAVEKFLKSVGRRKFISPIYKALAATPEGLERAKRIYAEARPAYHSVARGTLDPMLGFKA